MTGRLSSVMLVDDDELLSEFAVLVLEGGGLDVTYCPSGEVALSEVVSSYPQLILLDYIMPHMDGPETLKLLRQTPEAEHTPVVFLTGRSEVEAGDNELEALGAIGVVRKPINPANFAMEVSSIWKHNVH